MDLKRLYHILTARYGVERDERVLRIARKVRRRIQDQQRKKKIIKTTNPMDFVTGGSLFQILDHALQHNHKIISFDAEWTPFNPLTELGVTTFHNGEMISHNIRLVKNKGRAFLYGEDQQMSLKDGLMWLNNVMKGSSLLLGHALYNDRLALKKVGASFPSHIKVLDTYSWSKLIVRNPMGCSLKTLADFLEVPRIGAHVAGNDARITMECVIAAYNRFKRMIEEHEHTRCAQAA